ncbi:MAG: Tetracycline resistance protein, class C [Myxococcota bacterium]|nr:Tetracycline resistance protein, class C [Myxococcota bacterium]
MSQRKTLILLFVTIFVDLIGFGMITPIMPSLVKTYQASAWELGWVMTGFAIGQTLMAPVWGSLSDRLGRKPVIIATLFLGAVFQVLTPLHHNLGWLLAMRFLAGASMANVSVAAAFISDITPPEKRSASMALIGVAFGMGFIFGAPLGSLFSAWGDIFSPFYWAAAITALNAAAAIFVLPEPQIAEAERERRRNAERQSTWSMLRHKPTARMARIYFFFSMAIVTLEVVFVFHMREHFNYDQTKVGYVLAGMGVIMAAVQGGLVRVISHRVGDGPMTVTGLVLVMIGLFLLPFAPSVALLWVPISFGAVGRALCQPGMMAINSRGVTPDRQGAAMGVFQSAGSMARVIAPSAGGWLYDHLGYHSPFLFGSGLVAMALLDWFITRPPEPAPSPSTEQS